MKKSKSCFTVLFVILLTLTFTAAADLPAGKYIFVDTHSNIGGTSDQPQMAIDFPTYSYSTDTGVLRSMVDISLTDQTQVIIGGGISLSGSVGMGAATGLTLYDDLVKDGEFIITADGTVQYYYADQWISLRPGESWNLTVETTSYRGFSGQLIVKHRVTNYGILDKTLITAPNLPTPLPTVTATPTATPVSLLCGDVNDDGRVDILDALMLAQAYVGAVIYINKGAADVDGNGIISIIDALIIAQYYVGLRADLVCS